MRLYSVEDCWVCFSGGFFRSNIIATLLRGSSATGMVSLIAALVLGLLVATAKNKFDTTNQETEEFAAKLMLINRELVNFGPEANDARALLRRYTIAKIAATWPGEAGPETSFPPYWNRKHPSRNRDTFSVCPKPDPLV